MICVFFSRTVHEKSQKFTCPACQKEFSLMGNLKKHVMTVHEKVKNFKCDYCGRGFAQNVSLKKHLPICKMKPIMPEEVEEDLFDLPPLRPMVELHEIEESAPETDDNNLEPGEIPIHPEGVKME